MHSLEAILDAAVEILDADGPAGLTFRGLAAELGGGVGSIYWYVSGKQELIARATDAVVGRALQDLDRALEGGLEPGSLRLPARPRARRGASPTEKTVDDALYELRVRAYVLFGQLEAHPWAAWQLLRDDEEDEDDRRNSLLYWNSVGMQLRRMPLSDGQQFSGSIAFVNYITGVGAEMAAHLANPTPTRPRDELIGEQIARWRETGLDLPFVQAMIEQFESHDEFTEFVAGLDLLLTGLRQQALGD